METEMRIAIYLFALMISNAWVIEVLARPIDVS